MYVLAIDPGGTTGVVLAEMKPKDPNGFWDFDVVWAEEVLWEDRINELREIFCSVSDLDIKAVIVETFQLYAHAARSQINSTFPAVQVIGVVQVLAEEFGLTSKLVWQQPSARSRVRVLPHHKDAVKLSDHKRDAYRHARYWIVRNAKEYFDE